MKPQTQIFTGVKRSKPRAVWIYVTVAVLTGCALYALGGRPTTVKAQNTLPGRILNSTGDSQGGIIEFNTDGSNAVNLTANTFDGGCDFNGSAQRYKDSHATVSRDGRMVAFMSNRDGTGFRIFVMNADGTNLRQVTFNPGPNPNQPDDVDQDVNPVISPDGSRVVFISGRTVLDSNAGACEGTRVADIWIVNTDGTDLRRLTSAQITTSPDRCTGVGNIVSAVWNPEGTRLAFRGTRLALGSDGQVSFHKVVGTIFADGTLERTLTILDSTGQSHAIDWSPDGRYIGVVFGGEAQGAPQQRVIIYAVQQGSEPEIVGIRELLQGQPTGQGPGSFRFSPDSQRFVVSIVRDFNLRIQNLVFFNIDGSGGTDVSPPGGAAFNPFWWQGGAAIPVPARLELIPNPVVIRVGGPSVQLLPTLFDAQNNVIVRAATAWTIFCGGGAPNRLTQTGVLTASTNTGTYTDQLCASNGGLRTCVDVFGNTAAMNVSVPAPARDASATFTQVSASGNTTFTPINPPASAGAPPPGYTILANAPAYDITTTANYTGAIDVCLNAANVTDSTEFERLRLLHGENGTLVDRTLSRDFASKQVCARVTSLSPFVLASLQTIPAPVVAFSASAYSVGEGEGRVTLTVTRTGDSSGSSSVDYRTNDTDTFTVGCADTTNNHGGAYARCDFAPVVGTLTFAPGEQQPKQITVPIIDDARREGDETFQVQLSNPVGATAGPVATVTIRDNDTTDGPNPVYEPNPAQTSRTISFFVRQQYLDFLSREPEMGEPWSGVLNRCLQLPNGDPNNINNLNPASPSAGCDRILVSQSFFGSPEFRLKGFFVFRFYRIAFDRLPEYAEIVLDMSAVTGATSADTFARRAQFSSSFVQRPEFQTGYGQLSNGEYVTRLMGRYGLSAINTPDPAAPDGATKVTLTTGELTTRLNAGTLTRAQVLRAIVDSDEVGAAEFNNAFVATQYYGYLRRTPEAAGFQAWLRVLQAGDQRTMVNGFLNSTEYRLRFGQP